LYIDQFEVKEGRKYKPVFTVKTMSSKTNAAAKNKIAHQLILCGLPEQPTGE